MTPDELLENLSGAGSIRLFLDYDGTLADFAPTPDHVWPDPQVIDRIERLVATPGIHPAILSGRRLTHIEKLVPVPGVILAGTYGLEIRTPDGNRLHRIAFDIIRPTLQELKPRWESLLGDREGFYLEDKGWSLAIHAKDARAEESEEVMRAARENVVRADAGDSFRVLGGHRFLEFGPRLADKGEAVAYLLDHGPWPEGLPVYLGDDDKDEVAFGVIAERGGVSVLVSETPRDTPAVARLESPAAARRWLDELIEGTRAG